MGASVIDIVVPFEQEGTKAIVRSWLKKIGDTVAEHDPLVELETDKVTQEVPAPAAGILEEILLTTDDEAVPGLILGRLRALGDVDVERQVSDKLGVDLSPSGVASELQPSHASEIRILSPAVRRALIHHKVDPSDIVGTGRGGRITRPDVDNFVARRAEGSVATRVAAPSPISVVAPALSSSGGRSIPHDRMRLAIAQNMLHSATVAPHVTAVFEADFSAIIAHRKKQKSAFEQKGANLTLAAYIVAACVKAMKAAPAINSRWYEDRLEIFDHINIGVGTALGDKGLVVPVVAQAQELSRLGIASRLTDLTGRARDGKLTPADVRGGTFTISNHGVSGSLFASPIIIVQPQSAILGVGKLEKRVVVREVDGIDTIQIRPMCYVSLTIDHRVTDGQQTNLWLSAFVDALETWSD
jgi:2-oxoglutarate dehydrogenase E2 component (dihydrolipoamide succinyltransferase)